MKPMQDTPPSADVTGLLEAIGGGDSAAADRLLPIVYDDLRARARGYLGGSNPAHTLQPTALVHEAFLRLVGQTAPDWNGRTHFFAVASLAMRHILIDYARERGAAKRGGGLRRITLEGVETPAGNQDVDAFALHEALEELEGLDARRARLVELRFFGGLSLEEAAEVLGVSRRTAAGDWAFAKAWLRVRLEGGGG